MTDSIQILDCTLRDGGYYNQWDFSLDLVEDYLRAVEAAQVDVVEIGFRSFPQKRFLGAFAYSTDDFLSTLTLPKSCKIGVMVNAKELLTHETGPRDAVDCLFQQVSESPVDLVRVAMHFTELDTIQPALLRLKELGYQTTVNLMQCGGKDEVELRQAARTVREFGAVDILYFADSLGNMDTNSVSRTVELFADEWAGPVGVHTHNNMSQALGNCLAAIDAGATWLDSTVLGMGRGAGNVCSEYLLLELERRGHKNCNPDALFPLVMEPFTRLRREYGWGPNLLYYLSAQYDIHPTYVQEMLSHSRFETHHILSALETLKKSSANSYSQEGLMRAVQGEVVFQEGTWSAEGWAEGHDLLVLGAGPKGRAHANALRRFITNNQPKVVCLNAHDWLGPEWITAYAACHNARLLMSKDHYSDLKKPLIAPLGSMQKEVREKLGPIEILDYGLAVKPDQFEARATSCTVPEFLVAAYVMALGAASGARRILLAGFDGYEAADPRQEKMLRVFQAYQNANSPAPLIAITPTTYPLAQSSVYAPTGL